MYELFEQKLGTILNPNDYEIIKRLLETYTEDEIKEALDIAFQNGAKKVQYIVKTLYNMKKEESKKPEWLEKEYVQKPLTDEDKKEIEEAIECLRDFHPNDFEEWANKQRIKNGIKRS